MKCFLCNVDLVMSERAGVEIDYCPKCRGVWLDRGKLDKIIERSMGGVPGGSMSQAHPPQNHGDNDDSHYGYQMPGQHPGQQPRKRSWLGELFD